MSVAPGPGNAPAPHRFDVLALVTGVLVTGIAVVTIWLSVGGTVDWGLVKIVAPLLLVIVGVAGLAMSRRS